MAGIWPIGAVCALVAALAAAPEQGTVAQGPLMKTKILPGNGYIRYEVLPGDEEEPGGELIVLHEDRRPAPPPLPVIEEPPPPARRAESCLQERGKLLARLLELRGLQVDPDFAQWLEHSLLIGTRGITTLRVIDEPQVVSAIKTDSIARTLAEDLARCERANR